MKRIKFNKRKAKFFCEFCGNEVRQNDKVCQYCGKFFASVRCPNCGKSGRTEEFTHGCPACGYAVHGTRGLLGLSKSRKSTKATDGSLPIWIYIVVIAVLIICIIGLYGCL
ncbi:MAG: zinc ribbon domain-containing protein [Treponema sp.]|nr:zinc ribbon domain-containing protein [Treponema sp.]